MSFARVSTVATEEEKMKEKKELQEWKEKFGNIYGWWGSGLDRIIESKTILTPAEVERKEMELYRSIVRAWERRLEMEQERFWPRRYPQRKNPSLSRKRYYAERYFPR